MYLTWEAYLIGSHSLFQIEKFSLHIFDSIAHDGTHKVNLKRRRVRDPVANGNLKLLFAAANGHLKQVQHLVAQGVSVNCRDFSGRTPLHVAVAEGRTRVAQWLIENKVKLIFTEVKEFFILGKAPI